MIPDAYDEDFDAEELLSSAPRPGSPAPAAKLLLTASEDLYILDTRDWDDPRWQPSATEWAEEAGSVRLSWLGWVVVIVLGTLIGLLAAWAAVGGGR